MPGALASADLPKDEKRRRQNMEAAKKSYEAKKKERETLLKRNLELIDEQKRLLIEKGVLKDRVRDLERVMASLMHDCKEFSSPYDFFGARKSKKLGCHNFIITDTPLDMRKHTFSPEITDNTDNETISRSKEGFKDCTAVEPEANRHGSDEEADVDDLEEDRPLTIDCPDDEEISHDSDDDTKKSERKDQQLILSVTAQQAAPSPSDAPMSQEDPRPSKNKEGQPNAMETESCSLRESGTFYLPASGEDVTIDASALDLGAIQEVEVTSVPSKRKRGSGRRDSLERDVFLPRNCGREHVKPPKRSRAILA